MTPHPTVHILIIDDDADDRAILRDLLGAQGHTVTTADSGAEGLRLAREIGPDLIILDVMMPQLDGFTVCKALCADATTAEVPIIMATALDDRQSRLRCLAVGADEFLSKPIDTAELRVRVNAIARVNRYRRLLDERARSEHELGLLNAALEQRVADRTAELTAANGQLRELNAFKDTLLATTTHDLRSPLGAIQLLAGMLLEEPSLSDDLRSMVAQIDDAVRHVSAIDDAVRHVSAMVTTMLDLAKREAGKVVLESIELRASDVVHWSLQALAPSAVVKMIATQVVVAPGEPALQADWTQLTRIVTNLLSNAIKFTPLGGQITVTVEPELGGVCLRVADTGLGIPADALPHLFEKFHQIHAHGTAGERGTGLGLAIVHQLVELHGGSIAVVSVERRGSTFSVHLPVRAGASDHR